MIQSFFENSSGKFMTHSFVWSGFSDQHMLFLTENCLQHQYEWFLCSFVLTRWEMVQPVLVLTKTILQPAKVAAMRIAPCAETHPPPSIPPFLLVQSYLQIGLCQLVMCDQSCMLPNGITIVSRASAHGRSQFKHSKIGGGWLHEGVA